MTAEDTGVCPRCGSPRRLGAWAEFCPGCLLTTALAVDETLCCPYQVLAPISEGPSSTVYLARALTGARSFVELEVFAASVDAREVLDRFARWRRRLEGFRHPCVAAVTGAGLATPSQLYLAQDYVPGRALSDAGAIVEALTRADRLRLARELVAGLGAAHEAGLSHRALKPGQVRLTSSGGVRAVIVGLGRALLLADVEPAIAPDLLEIGEVLRALHVDVSSGPDGLPHRPHDSLVALVEKIGSMSQ